MAPAGLSTKGASLAAQPCVATGSRLLLQLRPGPLPHRACIRCPLDQWTLRAFYSRPTPARSDAVTVTSLQHSAAASCAGAQRPFRPRTGVLGRFPSSAPHPRGPVPSAAVTRSGDGAGSNGAASSKRGGLVLRKGDVVLGGRERGKTASAGAGSPAGVEGTRRAQVWSPGNGGRAEGWRGNGNGNGNGNGSRSSKGNAWNGMEEDGEEDAESAGEEVTAADLMDMVRDAEHSVQQLNSMYATTLSELSKTSTQRESLQAQVKVLGARLAGTQRQLHLLGFSEGGVGGKGEVAKERSIGGEAQAREQGQQQKGQERRREKELQAQVAAEQQRLEEKITAGNRVTELQEEVVRLQQRAAEREVVWEKVRHAEQQQAELEGRLEGARGEERRARERREEVEGRLEGDVTALRAEVARMEGEMAHLAHVEGQLGEVTEANARMEGDIARLKEELAQREGEAEAVVWAAEGEVQLMRAQLLKDVGEWQERAREGGEARVWAEEERGKREGVVAALQEVAEKQEKVLLRALTQLKTKLGEAVDSRGEVVKEAVREREQEITSVQNLVLSLQAHVGEREGEVAEARGQAEQLRAQLAAAEAAVEEWAQEGARLREEFSRDAETVGREMEEEARRVVERLRAVEREKEEVQAEVEAVGGVVEERERWLEEARGQRDELSEQVEEASRDVEGVLARVRGAERGREEAGVRGREVVGEVEGEMAVVVAREEELGWVEGELARLRDEAVRLAAVVEEADRLDAVAEEAGRMSEEVIEAIKSSRERLGVIQRERAEEEAEWEAAMEEWAEVEAERDELASTVESLKSTLVDADASLQVQLDLYRAQGAAFQEGLAAAAASREFYEGQEAAWRAERERIERKARWGQVVPAGELPWEYWSALLLKVDELMLKGLLGGDEAGKLRAMVWRRGVRVQEAWDEVGGMDVMRQVLQGWERGVGERGETTRGGVEVEEKGGGAVVVEDAVVAAALRAVLRDDPKDRRPLHVVHIAAEMAPVAKVGGLADVVTGLSRALQQRGHLVEIILPKYDCMDYSRIIDLKHVPVEFSSYFDGQQHPCKIWRGMVEGLPVYFLEPQHPARLFWRGTLYGCSDDFRRFSFFCRAALEFLCAAGKRPDIIHTHDWQTALVAPLYHDVFLPRGFSSARLAFTCHNFEYQGTEAPPALLGCGLDPARHNTVQGMRDNQAGQRINALKGGIVYSDVVTTVSPTYAMEVRGAEKGRGLHATLQQHADKFRGVLNGIDAVAWDPLTDPLLPTPYSAEDAVQGGKAANKAHLKAMLGLSDRGADANKPLVVCVTRLVPQKGVHLIRHAIFRAMERGAQFVLLGSSPVPDIQRDFEGIAQQLGGSGDVRLVLKYDEQLSHLLFAAADLAIIPSIFEPCGLTQLIAMRYGAIPLVRRTGGLADSVFDADDASIPVERRNGFSFTNADVQSFNGAFDRAIARYYEQPQWWQDLVLRAMTMDFSWGQSSEQYEELYLQCLPTRSHA